MELGIIDLDLITLAELDHMNDQGHTGIVKATPSSGVIITRRESL